MYLAFANSIKGWKHCRPVIVIDQTYLKTSFGGTLFTASTIDSNNNIFPLAFGIGNSENDSSWLVFHKAKGDIWRKRRFHAPIRRYTMMTSNIAESINVALKAGRTLPITTMMEGLRSLVQKWVWKNGNEANGTFTKVTTDTETVLRENFIWAIKFQVFPVNTILYQVVVEYKENFLVNLMEKTCECKRFQQDEIPCAHAIAVFANTRLKTYDYVADYYNTTTMKATYESIVHPLPNESEWTLPETLNKIVLPPKLRKPPSSPRRKRIRTRGEPKVQIKCGRCGQPGHN
ncbi:uncharacterized protein LOC133785092 [Humulus lupulus]|uniref:uncharacterized protein LOC133785092 n=1 Tax=Humulus lupulus TaxID=3486 RepID=UPI002B40D09A|nr:uncharacterized protein LOC133785092 [Humulus lupulus]